MHKSFRTFTLQALRTSPLEISGKISEHKSLLESSTKHIENSILKFTMIWSFIFSSAFALFIGLIFLNIFLPFFIFFILIFTSLTITKFPALRTKLTNLKRFSEQNKQIKQSTQAIDELYNNAKDYQKRLEQSSGPGFVSTFEDVLLSPYYPSFFPIDDRIKFIALSQKSSGQEIDIYEYGRLLFELKSNGILDYSENSSLVEKVAPQNKYNAAIEFARLLTKKLDSVTAEEIRLTAIVGLNAWFSCEAQGKPAITDNDEHEMWELTKSIFQHTINQNSVEFDKLLQRFIFLDHKRLKKRS